MNHLFLRISVGMLVALLISVILAAQAIRIAGPNRLIKEHFQTQHQKLKIIEQRLSSVPDSALAAELERLQTAIPGVGESLRIVKEDDPSIPSSIARALLTDPSVPDFTDDGIWVYCRISDRGYILVSGPVPAPLPLGPLHLLMALAVILSTVAISGYLLARPVAKRLHALEKVTLSFGMGDLDARAHVSGSDSIGDLAARFNQMAERMQRLITDQRYLLQAVAHELRQPLSRIRFNVELMVQRDDVDERMKRGAKLEQEIEELDKLVKELMQYVRMETNEAKPETQELSLDSVLEEIVEKYRTSRLDIALLLDVPATRNVRVRANETQLRRAVGNLLSNAVRAAKSEVTVSFYAAPGGTVIAVTDDGEGIPISERDRIFKPFVRLDESRSRDRGGVGLGLAIVQRILESHGGSIEISGQPGQESRFITFWPAGDTEQD